MNIYEEALKVGAGRENETSMLLWGSDGERLTYSCGEVFAHVDNFAETLLSIGLKRGFRVAIVAESCPDWSIAYLAALKLGCTPALIDASLPAADVRELIAHCDPACICASAMTAEKAGDCHGLPVLDIHNHGQAYSGFEGRMCPPSQTDCDQRIASIIYSSGTTRRASGIMHSHESIIGSVLMCCNNNGIGAGDRLLGVLPNSHIYGLYVQVIAPLILGGSVCFIETLDAACLSGALSGFKPTVFPAVPKVFDLLRTSVMKKINSDQKNAKLFSIFFPICLWLRKHTGINLGSSLFKSVHEGFGGCMKIMASAGAPTSRETSEFYYGVGLTLLITYGATETSIPVIGNYGGHLTSDTCGRPYPEVTISQTPEGEFMVKSPYLMTGYFRDEAATRACYDADGWFKTGDQGYIDARQNVHFTGRTKENIVLATGKKVAPDDIEAAYAGIPGVQDYAICGIPVSEGGHDTVHAFIVAEGNDTDAIREALQVRGRGLSQEMKLTGIHFVDAIPKTTLQKPKRYLLHSMLQEEQPQAPAQPACTEQSLRDLLVATVARIADIDPCSLTGDTRIFEDLAIDSLSAIELLMEVEGFAQCEFSKPPHKHITFDELVALAMQMQTDVHPAKASPGTIVRQKRNGDYGLFNLFRSLIGKLYVINTTNAEQVPEDRGYIICANHVTNFDYVFLSAKFKKEQFMTFCCMAKKEIPTWLGVSRIAGMIPVDRKGNALDSIKVAKEKLKENWGLLIHPEGARSRNGEMGLFKPGAALLALESGVPIIPAYIRGGYDIYPAGRFIPRLFNWKDRSRYKVDVIYGEPISPENQTVDTLMQNLTAAIQRISGEA